MDRRTTGKRNSKQKLKEAGMTKFTRNIKTISGRLHDEMVMMDIEQGRYFSLNPVATRIWDMMDKPLDIDELCSKLHEEYDVSPEQCRREVEEHLGELVKLGLVFREEK